MAVGKETTAHATRPAGVSGPRRAPVPSARDRQGHFLPRPQFQEIPEDEEAVEAEFPESREPESVDLLDYPEPVPGDPEDDEEAQDDEAEETEPPATRGPAYNRAAQARVKALLDEALRLGQQHGLIAVQADGTLSLPGQARRRRTSSDCDCAECTPWNQIHWLCVMCSSGPHDWRVVSPKHDKIELNPGGIDGRRLAVCSNQCAQDLLQSLGRLPSGTRTDNRSIDPSLALPGL